MRYTDKDWASAYQHSRSRLKVLVGGEGLDHVVATEAQLMLKAHYRGPWRMVAAIIRRELASLWLHYGWCWWEWVRTRIFGRPKDAMLAEHERASEEADAVEEMVRQL